MGTWTFSIVKYVVRALFSWKFIERMVGNTFNVKHIFIISITFSDHFQWKDTSLDFRKHLFPFLSSILQVLPLLQWLQIFKLSIEVMGISSLLSMLENATLLSSRSN